MNRISPPVRVLIGGIGALVIAMGIGRFAYTPILPYLQQAVRLSDAMAGYLASFNYLGYLLGALLAGLFRWNGRKTLWLHAFLAVNIATTLLMGMTESYMAWLLLRLISGLTSGIVFVLASSVVLDALAAARRPALSGLLYSGVGLGITISGIAVPLLADHYSWSGACIGLGLVALGIGTLPLLWLKEHPPEAGKAAPAAAARSDAREEAPGKTLLPWLIASYGCEGFGYIISGTFLVAIVHGIPAFGALGALSWVLVGAAAIPSSVMWARIAAKYGNAAALHAAFLMQIAGVMMPVLLFNAYGALIGAVLFGATFMGITTLSVSEARSIMPADSSKVIGYMTFVYGIGQMIGPSAAGLLITRSGGYGSSLLFAAAVLLLGLLLLAAGRRRAAAKLKS